MDLEEIRSKRKPWKAGTCGVYFLFDDEGNLLYVGQSICVEGRLIQHVHLGKKFHSVTVLECEREDLEGLEATYIIKFKPRLNWRGDVLIYNGNKLSDFRTKQLNADPR